MNQKILNSLYNTLWLLIPSFIAALFLQFQGAGVIALLMLFLFFNIPFFVGSWTIFYFVEKKIHPISSIALSNIIVIGAWIITFYSWVYLANPELDESVVFLFLIMIVALIIFFFRSVVITCRAENVVTDSITTPLPSMSRKKSIIIVAVVGTIVVFWFAYSVFHYLGIFR